MPASIRAGGAISLSALAVLAFASCTTLPDPVSAPTTVTEYQCYAHYPEELPLVTDANAASAAAVCARASASEGRPVRDIVNAMYHAGDAERRVAERLLRPDTAAGGAVRCPNDAQPAQQGSAADEAARCLINAERHLSQALSLRDDRQDVRLALAWVHYDQRRYQDALGEIAQVLREQDNPVNWTHASAHYLRGLVLHATGDELSALTDWETLTSDALDRHIYATEARRRIVAAATRLGVAALNSGTRETTQNAIALFARAQSAAEASAGEDESWAAMQFPIPIDPAIAWPGEFERVSSIDAAGILTNLGRARLQLAGLSGPIGVGDFKCEADAAAPDLLNLARQDFDSALARAAANTASAAAANRGKACALLALGRTSEAVAAAQATVPGPETSPLRQDWRNWRMLGRAQARAEQHQTAAASLIAAGNLLAAIAPTDFVGDQRAERADIHIETADMYFAPPTDDTYQHDAPSHANIPAALASLNEAIAIAGPNATAPRFAIAYLKRGKIRFSQINANGAVNQAMIASARSDFNQARTLTNDTGDRFARVRSETLYYLSRLDTDYGDAHSAESAIDRADAAFALNALPLYRRQACLSRIHFRRVAAADQNYCAAAGASASDANDHLLQGMYSLRQAHVANSEGGRHRAWEAAYRAFETGLRVLSSAGGAENQSELRARLLLGQATAQSCVGFAQIGTDMENAIEGQVGQLAYDRAHAFFELHRVMTCDGLPPHRR